MSRADRRAEVMRAFAVRILLGVPLVALAAKAMAWLRCGIDLPFQDDWRFYATGKATSLDPEFLFTSGNDTFSPVGILQYVLAQRFLDGNTIAYQFLSMTLVLGALLVLQWRLLSLALGDRLLAASAFSFTVFMLQPGTYWGRQNSAYPQILPLVFLLGGLLLVLGANGLRRWMPPAVALLGLLAGLSYVSGAFAVAAAGATLLAAAPWIERGGRRPLLGGGAALLLAGVATSALQLRAVIGGTSQTEGRVFAFPNEGGFWFYLLGKIARAASLQALPPLAALALTLLLAGAVLALLGLLLGRLRREGGAALAEARLAIVFLSLVVTILVYLGLVTAARAAGFERVWRPPLAVFAKGFLRFHFAWVTLLWPWLVAALLRLAGNTGTCGGLRSRQVVLALALPLAVLPAAASAGVFAYVASGREQALQRVATDIACLQEALRDGGPIQCFDRKGTDFRPAYEHAQAIGASFTRLYAPLTEGAGEEPVFRLSTADPGSWSRRTVKRFERSAREGGMMPDEDTALLFTVVPSARLETCRRLEVRIETPLAGPRPPRLFYRRSGHPDSLQEESATAPFRGSSGDGVREAVIRAASAVGFRNEFRLSVAGGQPFAVREVVARCRARAGAGAPAADFAEADPD